MLDHTITLVKFNTVLGYDCIYKYCVKRFYMYVVLKVINMATARTYAVNVWQLSRIKSPY